MDERQRKIQSSPSLVQELRGKYQACPATPGEDRMLGTMSMLLHTRASVLSTEPSTEEVFRIYILD